MGDRVASLPMYGEIEHRPVIEQWWTGVARHLCEQGIVDVPGALAWPDDIYGHWRSPHLLFSQTCGHPLVNIIAQDVQLIATPHYDVSGCEGPYYASYVLVHEESDCQGIDDLRGCRLAVNGTDSYSGYHVWPRVLPDAEGLDTFFDEVIQSGAHRASVRCVREKVADVCAVDCVTHALLGDQVPDEISGTRVLMTSPQAPALPFITSAATSTEDVAFLREGLFAALADPSLAAIRAALRLTGASVLTESDYVKVFGR